MVTKRKSARNATSAKKSATARSGPAARVLHDHSGVDEAHRHGLIALHLADFTNKGQARTAVQNANVALQQVDVSVSGAVDGFVVALVADAAQRSMDAFHLALDRVAAQYLTLLDAAGANFFAFEHHF